MAPKKSTSNASHQTGSKSNYAQGMKAEKQVMSVLKQTGYSSVKQSAGSRGTYDIVATKNNQHHGFQVKSSHTKGSEPTMTKNEMDKLRQTVKSVPQITPHVVKVNQVTKNITDTNIKSGVSKKW
jgi:Holliday junction resolvase